MESTLHTLHRLISSLNSISFSEFGFLVLMGGSAPLNPPITVGDWCDTDMPLMRFALTLPLQTVICSPGRRQAARGNQEVKIPTGASPWARNYLIRTANPRLQSQTDLSGAPTSRYDTLHPSAHPGLRSVRQREGQSGYTGAHHPITLREAAIGERDRLLRCYKFFQALYIFWNSLFLSLIDLK